MSLSEFSSPVLLDVKADKSSLGGDVSVRGMLSRDLLKHELYYELLHQRIGELPSNATMLDVGCGLTNSPRAGKMAEFASRVSQTWGIEPDTSGEVPAHYSRVWRSTLEDADVPTESVDLMVNFFVIEHIQSPDKFIDNVLRILKPGGVFVAATVNLNCVFARIAKASQTLGVQDQLLRLIRGKAMVDDFHYPAYYLLNTYSAIESQVHRYETIESADLLYLENDEWFHYLPKPVRGSGVGLRKLFHRNPLNYTYLFITLKKKS